jgi:NAD(P)-dependent dehydrogenase (short-subunit alcohol dehydrogenase family)
MRLSGKNVIITGGSRGIGRAAVELFAEEGAKVFNLDISLDEQFNHPNIEFIQHDVTDFDAWEKVTKEISTMQEALELMKALKISRWRIGTGL